MWSVAWALVATLGCTPPVAGNEERLTHGATELAVALDAAHMEPVRVELINGAELVGTYVGIDAPSETMTLMDDAAREIVVRLSLVRRVEVLAPDVELPRIEEIQNRVDAVRAVEPAPPPPLPPPPDPEELKAERAARQAEIQTDPELRRIQAGNRAMQATGALVVGGGVILSFTGLWLTSAKEGLVFDRGSATPEGRAMLIAGLTSLPFGLVPIIIGGERQRRLMAGEMGRRPRLGIGANAGVGRVGMTLSGKF